MKRFIVVLSLIASPALAQIGPVPAGGAGSIGSGTSLTSCTSSILYADASSLLKCDPAAVVSGSVSTAGRSILTIKDTISGASATSNFLNITGTFPATLSAETSAGLVSVTGDNDAQTQNGFKAVLASAGANSRQRGLSALVSGTHVNIESQAIYGENTSVGASGWSIGVAGNTVVNTAAKSLSGMTAVASASNANGTNTVGGWFVGGGNGGTTTNIFGVIGTAYSTGTNGMGGFFFLNSTSGLDPFGNFPNNYATVTGKAALVADNTSVAANIFEARDNGTATSTTAASANVTILDGAQMRLGPMALTSSTMTPSIVSEARTVTHAYAWTNAMVTALGASTTGDINVAVLPAKTRVEMAYIVIDSPDSSANALTVGCGDTGAGAVNYVKAGDAKAAANTVYGDNITGSETGTSLFSTFFITNYVPSYTATTTVSCRFTKTTSNLNTVTGSTGRVILITSLLP